MEFAPVFIVPVWPVSKPVYKNREILSIFAMRGEGVWKVFDFLS